MCIDLDQLEKLISEKDYNKKSYHTDLILRRLLEKCKEHMKWWGSKLIKADSYNYHKKYSYNRGCSKGGPV